MSSLKDFSFSIIKRLEEFLFFLSYDDFAKKNNFISKVLEIYFEIY